ncbi:MAG: hypothetical protein E4H36_09830 [Spirochaetales bacterium]|nr:MAG: hypothetical protein E4H36_09830 [Spirochaetales bacterium]
MKRIEIIANKTVEENIHEALSELEVGQYYTKFAIAHGRGKSGTRFGDAVWPEENFILLIYAGEREAELIKRAVGKVKNDFPAEGIKLFELG